MGVKIFTTIQKNFLVGFGQEQVAFKIAPRDRAFDQIGSSSKNFL